MKKSFFIIFSVFFLFIFACFNIKTSNAGVYFITKPDMTIGQEDSKPCQMRGYTKTAKTCAEIGKILKEICPQNSKLGRDCGCDNKFQYNASNCTQNKTLSGGSCDGKYEKCECNKSIYKYSSNDCQSPLTLDYNDYCVNLDNSRSYKTCSCASEYSQTCSGNFEGVGTACNGKYTSCKCKSNFMKCDNGGANGAQSCTDDQGTKYSSCKQFTCADGEDCPYCRDENAAGNPCKGYHLCAGSKVPYGKSCKCGKYTYYEKCLVPETCMSDNAYNDTPLGKCYAYEEDDTWFSHYGYYKIGLKCTQQNGTNLYCYGSCDRSSKDILGNYAPCKGKIQCPNDSGTELCECGGKKYFSSCDEICTENVPYNDTPLGKCYAYEEDDTWFSHYGYYKIGLKCTQQSGTKLFCGGSCKASTKDILGNDAPCKGKIECPNNQGTGLCECGGIKYFSSCDEICTENVPYNDTPLGKCYAYEEDDTWFSHYGYYKIGLKCTQQSGTKLFCRGSCNESTKDILGNDAPCKGKIQCPAGTFATGEICSCGGKSFSTTCAATCNYQETPESCQTKGKTFSRKCIDSDQNQFGQCI